MKQGNFSIRLPAAQDGLLGEIAQAFNEVVSLNEKVANEIARVSKVVGEEGKLTERASQPALSGMWATNVEAINTLIDSLAQPTTEVGRVITAVAQGDLSQKMALEIKGRSVKGEFLRIGTIVNTMVDQLGSFASEVTRVAKEVGTEGKLGGQAEVKGVAGTWKGLTDNVNAMAGSLTAQVRDIARVTTAVANGDLSQKITVDVKGEILQLKDTVNKMVDNLNTFAGEVTRVAKEVGTEGKLGGQAEVKGVAGTWKDLTDNVNAMASNLTVQVRDIVQGGHGHRQRRPDPEDHRGRQGRDPADQGHDQQDGRSTQYLRRRGDPRGQRGGYRGQARRPGRGQRRGRHLERSDRQRQCHGQQPDRRRCATSPAWPRPSPTATWPRRSRWMSRGKSWS